MNLKKFFLVLKLIDFLLISFEIELIAGTPAIKVCIDAKILFIEGTILDAASIKIAIIGKYSLDDLFSLR